MATAAIRLGQLVVSVYVRRTVTDSTATSQSARTNPAAVAATSADHSGSLTGTPSPAGVLSAGSNLSDPVFADSRRSSKVSVFALLAGPVTSTRADRADARRWRPNQFS